LLLLTAISSWGANLTPRLQEKMTNTPLSRLIPVRIIMSEQADPQALQAKVAALNGDARRQAVISTLEAMARDSQGELLSTLRTLQKEGDARRIRSLWIVNCAACDLTPRGIKRIAGIDGIDRIDLNENQMVLADSKFQDFGRDPKNAGFSVPATDTAWGVKWINAPLVWNDGYKGAGVRIGLLDTGIDYNHTDLANRIWNNPGEIPNNGIDDDGNGYIDDYHGYNFNAHTKDPLDDMGHGTHCAGTICGDGTGGTQTGVAPEATIMGLKVLDSGGSGNEADVWEAIQYAIDNGAMAMSLSIGWIHTVHNPDRAAWRTACTNALVAGVTMCVAAGNERSSGDPAPDNVRTPGDCPPPWLNPDQTLTGGLNPVVTVGAIGYKTDVYADFSSYGPVSWEAISPWLDYPYNPEMGLMDPDVCAPGTNVNSTTMGGGYSGDTWSGTSMATPHVAGTVALILSKNPLLAPADVDQILETTAIDLGPAGKDNDYGAGRIDAYQAYLNTPAPTGPHVTVTSYTVYDTLDGDGDGCPDPGETVVMTVTLKNGGADSARATIATLSTADTFVTMLDSLGSFGDLAPGDSQIVNDGDPFTFSLDMSSPREHSVLFTLNIAANSGSYTASRVFSVSTGVIQTNDPGGPDAFGYYCYDVTDVRYTEVPIYNWRAIDTTQTAMLGTSLDLGDDEVARVKLPFTFRYYGVDYDTLTVSSDGWISPLVAANSYHNNRCIPVVLPWGPRAMIAGLWDDLDPGNSWSPSDVYYYYDDTDFVFVVEYFEVEHFPVGDRELFEFVIYDPFFYPTLTGDAEIEIHYVRQPQQSDVTVGIQDVDQTTGLKYDCDDHYEKGAAALTSSFVVKFTTDPPVEQEPAVFERPASDARHSRPLELLVTPNPFSSSTNLVVTGLSRSLPGEGLSLRVFDVSGRLIRTLVNDMKAGSATVLWDGRNDSGDKVTSGVYFVRLFAKGESVTKKAVLLR
jgi:serine protease AprX